MKISQKGIDLIKEFEGLRLTAYQDSVGVWTVGYGSSGKHVHPGMHITEDEAEELLRHDLERFEACINRMVKVPLKQWQFDALCSWTYNLGCHALHRSTLLNKLNAGDEMGASDEFLKWTRAGGRILAGLVNRRGKERDEFLGNV